jgi:hypothetical protein
MPWALRDRLILTALPTINHLDKHRWGSEQHPLAILSLSRPPASDVINRCSWWQQVRLADGKVEHQLDDIIFARDVAFGMYTRGYTTVIHCVAGRNRSGLIGALVIRERDNMTGPEALEEVRRLRPRSVDNDHFEQFLMSLGRPLP